MHDADVLASSLNTLLHPDHSVDLPDPAVSVDPDHAPSPSPDFPVASALSSPPRP